MSKDKKQLCNNYLHAPPAVREIVQAVVDRALSKCLEEGFTYEQFYRAMKDERTFGSDGDLLGLIKRTFARLRTQEMNKQLGQEEN